MIALPTTGQPLEQILDGASTHLLDSESKQRLVDFCWNLAGLGRQNRQTTEAHRDGTDSHRWPTSVSLQASSVQARQLCSPLLLNLWMLNIPSLMGQAGKTTCPCPFGRNAENDGIE